MDVVTSRLYVPEPYNLIEVQLFLTRDLSYIMSVKLKKGQKDIVELERNFKALI